jgi:hypothetical protein
MIDILNSKPGDDSIYLVNGSKGDVFFEIDLNTTTPETLAIVTDFFNALPKTVGVIVENIDTAIEIKYFSSDVAFDENITFIDYLNTEHKVVIDNFINLINTFN